MVLRTTMLKRVIFLCLCFHALQNVESQSLKKFSLLMPNVAPKQEESYLCTPVRIDPSIEYYVTAFEPNATMDTAHHMLVYGCSSPGAEEEVWNCGGMAKGKQPGVPSAPPCAKDSQIIYAWAKNARKLVLPEGVGFKVGGKTDIQYLVLQVHYASVDKFKDGTKDDSGVFLYYTKQKQDKIAGVLMLGTGGRILPNSVEYMESACSIQQDIVIHPFAYRVHTHSLGRVVSGYKVERDGFSDKWTLLGKKDPQLPQMFYPIVNKTVLLRGDAIAARCTMKSDRDRVTRVGQTAEDEMCNFYLMYYTYNDELMKQKFCYSLGPPSYYWTMELSSIPKDASTLTKGA